MILEAPRLDLGGSGIGFSDIFACFGPRVLRTGRELDDPHNASLDRCSSEASRRRAEYLWSIFSKRSSHRHDAKNAKNAKYVKSAKSFPCMPGAKCGGAAVSPPRGSSIRRPPQVCQRRAKFISNWLLTITAGQSRHSFEQFDLRCSFPYPFLSPGA